MLHTVMPTQSLKDAVTKRVFQSQLLERNSQRLVRYRIPSTWNREKSCTCFKDLCVFLQLWIRHLSQTRIHCFEFPLQIQVPNSILGCREPTQYFNLKKRIIGERWQWKCCKRSKRLKIKVFTGEVAGLNLRSQASIRAYFTPVCRWLKQKLCRAKNV